MSLRPKRAGLLWCAEALWDGPSRDVGDGQALEVGMGHPGRWGMGRWGGWAVLSTSPVMIMNTLLMRLLSPRQGRSDLVPVAMPSAQGQSA